MPDPRFTATCANQVYEVIRDSGTEWLTCGQPIRRCGHKEHLVIKGKGQLTIAYCGGWVHESGSPRCYHPDGRYGPEGAARPAAVTSSSKESGNG